MPLTTAALFELHHLAIYRYLLRMSGSRDVAEDLTQEVFLRVLRGTHRYEERDRERAWLFRIARNLRIDQMRHEQRAPAPDPLAGMEIGAAAPQGVRLSLQRALEQLQPDDREAFVLAEVSGLSYVEIATTCETTVAAVRSRIYRARQALRSALERPSAQGRVMVREHHG